MSIRMMRLGHSRIFSACTRTRSHYLSSNSYCSTDKNDVTPSENNASGSLTDAGASPSADDKVKRGGFARAFEKFTAKDIQEPEVEESFATLLRNSKFIDLGDPEGKLVEGTIYHVIEDDLYIDFGWKFPCVCARPARNGRDYVRGAKVLLRLKDLELSTRFLGAERDLTLLEADATLTALLYSPARSGR